MHALRTSSTLIRLVLACFALTLGVAMASPLIAPKMIQAMCSDGSAVRLIVVDKDGMAVDNSQHTLDCALCLPASLPAPVSVPKTSQAQPLAHALTPIEEARIAALVGAPLPPRGPPAHA